MNASPLDTSGQKTPAPLPFAAWQAMSPANAAHEVHSRIAALPDKLRNAALAWLRPEQELGTDLGRDGCPQPSASYPLHRIPYLLKDLFDVAGVPTKAGSTFLEKTRPTPGDSQIVRRLRSLGAALVGKTHLVEFASGLTGENPHYGDCPHPRFPDRLSGGSSSGSAALVGAGVVPLAIGTDTGGSIRVPAAWCGLYGFRLTPGDALIHDAFPLAPTMDTAGWFTANAADMLTTWRALVGNQSDRSDPSDPTDSKITGCYLPTCTLLPTIDPTVADACDRAAAQFASRADAATEAALLSSWQNAVDAYVTIGMSEAHAVHRDWLAPYREHYDPVIWQRFTDAGNYSAEKIAAARATLTQVRRGFSQFFATHDFLILPSVPTAAPTKAECTLELRRDILALTAPASLAGLPVLSLPVTLPSGLTAGLQVILPDATSPVVPGLLRGH